MVCLDWTLSAEELALRVRALQPWPGTYTYWQDNPLKIIRARSLQLDITPIPGKVSIANKGLHVQTGKGTLEILTLQPAGRATMEARAFLAGYPGIGGSVLGR